MEKKKSAGLETFAHFLDDRMREHSEQPLVLDFGTIKKDFSLVTDTFQNPIPAGEYYMCESYKEKAKANDKVLVAWVQDDPVVIDRYEKA